MCMIVCCHRFSPEGKEGRNPLSHIPFGWGPRSCIGMRFALMEAKACLVSILRKYKFERSPDTQVRFIELCMCLFIVL